MTLTTHAVVGAAIVSLIPTNPALGIVLAFSSHYALDALPHWDYVSIKDSKPRTIRIGLDTALGMFLSAVFFSSNASPWLWAAGASAAILPDIFWSQKLNNFYIVKILQRFHEWIHTKVRIGDAGLGVLLQVVLISVVILFVHK